MQKKIQRAVTDRFHKLARKAAEVLQRRANPILTSQVRLKPDGLIRGAALVAHVVEGVMLHKDDPLLRTHNHFLEAKLIASCLLERGYTVDFINYENGGFVPRKTYDLFISARKHMERVAARLNPDCIKIVHLDTSHWLQNNHAALDRLHDVRNRRGVALQSYKAIEHNRGIEAADFATLLGNQCTYRSYAFAGKPVFQVPNPGTSVYGWDGTKDFETCRKSFIWLGSAGLVHKGLDVVLEAFARMPELHLTVCGPIEKDRHFADAFRAELYQTPNIHTHGWIDVTGPEFAALVNRTIGHVYPTCAEGAAGAVINSMHAGLIPVTTAQSGVDIDASFGRLLPDLSVEAVVEAVRAIAALPPQRLAAMARASQDEAQRVYSQERYREVFGHAIDQILTVGSAGLGPGFVSMRAVGADSQFSGGPEMGHHEASVERS